MADIYDPYLGKMVPEESLGNNVFTRAGQAYGRFRDLLKSPLPSANQMRDYLISQGVDPVTAARRAGQIEGRIQGQADRTIGLMEGAAGAGAGRALGAVRGAVNPPSQWGGVLRPPANPNTVSAASPGLNWGERAWLAERQTTPMVAGQKMMPLRPVTAGATMAAAAPIMTAMTGIPSMPFGSRPAAAGEVQGPPETQGPPIPASLRSPAARTGAAPRASAPAPTGTATAPLPPQRPAPLGRASEMYQSNGQPLVTAGRINWGDPDNPADFARADAINQRISGYASGGTVDRAMRVAQSKEPECHSGIINMAVGGRTDHIPMHVLANSYVLPADIVSGLGEGNTLAGTEILNRMFKMGPYGTEPAQHRASPKFPQAERMSSQYEPPKYSKRGGAISEDKKAVPIIAAGGEYVVPPEVVKMLGEGSEDAGHEYLDNFVKYVRDHVAKTLKNLPGPRRD